jgi:hypothetical protein
MRSSEIHSNTAKPVACCRGSSSFGATRTRGATVRSAAKPATTFERLGLEDRSAATRGPPRRLAETRAGSGGAAARGSTPPPRAGRPRRSARRSSAGRSAGAQLHQSQFQRICIAPAVDPKGRGVGIFATRIINPGEELVSNYVPHGMFELFRGSWLSWGLDELEDTESNRVADRAPVFLQRNVRAGAAARSEIGARGDSDGEGAGRQEIDLHIARASACHDDDALCNDDRCTDVHFGRDCR